MNWRETWPLPQPGADDPGRGGMSQLGAYEAGLADDPGAWVQSIEVYWSPRLDPESPEYDPEFAARVAFEEPGPGQAQTLAEPPGPDSAPEPEAGSEPELPF